MTTTMYARAGVGLAFCVLCVSAQQGSIQTINNQMQFNLPNGGNNNDFVFAKPGTQSVSLLSTLSSMQATIDVLASRLTDAETSTTSNAINISTLQSVTNSSNYTLMSVNASVTAINSQLTAMGTCPPGQMFNTATQTCTTQLVQLSQVGQQQCNSATRGLMVLSGSQLQVCPLEADFFVPVYTPPRGTDVTNAAPNCSVVKLDVPFALDGLYWLQYPGAPNPVQLSCLVDPLVVDLGGNGSTQEYAAVDCRQVAHLWPAGTTMPDTSQAWINPSLRTTSPSYASATQQTCNLAPFRIFSGISGTPSLSGTPNSYGYVTANISSGATSVSIMARSGSTYTTSASDAFSAGDVVLIHQTQLYDSAARSGLYEYNKVTSVSGATLQLQAPLSRAYASGQANVRLASRVTQVIKVATGTSVSVPSGNTVSPAAWDGMTGGILAVYAAQSLSIDGTVQGAGLGFRGGPSYPAINPGRCQGAQSIRSAGFQGESWTGLGELDNISWTPYRSCSGLVAAAPGYLNRGMPNGGGGGGGSGSCHGGGGAGGAYTELFTQTCTLFCGTGQHPGDGSPECSRSGSWSTHGAANGDASLNQLMLGSGGGAGNGYSPACNVNEANNGGNGGGSALLAAGSGGISVTGTITMTGNQGLPMTGTAAAQYWTSRNTQDGSGGGGSGGGVKFVTPGTVSLGTGVTALGGACGLGTAWRHGTHQSGAGGAWGRVAVNANSVTGSVANTQAYTFTRYA